MKLVTWALAITAATCYGESATFIQLNMQNPHWTHIAIGILCWALIVPAAVSQGRATPSVESRECSNSPCSQTTEQSSTDAPRDNGSSNSISVSRTFLNLPGDQKAIWTSPLHLRKRDSFWVVPLIGATGVLIGSDQHSMQRARSNSSAIELSRKIADGGLIGMAALPTSMYLWGSYAGASHLRETGLLSGEAMIDSLAVNEVLKQIFGRERPASGEDESRFFQRFGNSASFPSTHATLSWTAASVIAHEYPGPLSQAVLYGAATAVSISRATARQHFPSDVVVGSVLGWLIGRQVYNAHHDPELDGFYGAFQRQPGKEEVDPDKLGSPYVPLDSWVYPQLQRLAALGYIKTQLVGIEPWTREECRRQIEEASYYAQDLPDESPVSRAIHRLREEFSSEPNRYYTAQIDSIYSRYTQIRGIPLRDSYHFGQTLWNDFGRPYEEGANVITGSTGSAVAGPFFFYAQAEYQHAPGGAALPIGARQAVARADSNPVLPAVSLESIDRFYPIDMYAGLRMGEYSVMFGKQSLWLGPTENGPLTISENADPMYMLRLDRTSPLVLPGILHWLGSIRGELLFSKLSGHQFPQRPFFNLQKISFRLTDNLEVGFTRASIWAGAGHPFTADALWRNFTSLTSPSASPFGDRTDPGDRKSGFDFSYRIPGLRNWLTVYSDMYSDDDPSPLANPRRAAVNPGFYLSHLPGFPRLDLRGEAVSTQMLTSADLGPQFLYFNSEYHDANTNKGFLFGNATGRDARSYQGWSSYHFSATNALTLSFRQLKTSNAFFSGGGTQSETRISFAWEAVPGVLINAFLQRERWLIPVIRSDAQIDTTAQIRLTYSPHWRKSLD